MFDQQSLLHLQAADGALRTNQALKDAGINESVVAAPDNVKLHDIEKFLPAPRHYKLKFSASSLSAFVDYCNCQNFHTSAAFVDPVEMSAVCVFDLGSPSEPLHGFHKACIEFKRTAEMKALYDICDPKSPLSQRALAEWMEEWRHNISATRDGEHMDLQVAILAIRNVDVKTARKVGSVVGNFSESASVFTERAVDSAIMPPDTLHFNCMPFADLSERSFQVRISALTSADTVQFKLRILNHDAIREKIGQEICDQLSQRLHSVNLVHMGTVNVGGRVYE